MPTLDRDGHEGLGWPVPAADATVPSEGPVLLDLERFRENTGRHGPTGVVLETTTPHEVLDEVAPQAAAIAIRFPLFRDGRGFTLVRRLRERLGYAGPVIVIGHVLPDQWPLLRTLGASAVQIDDGAVLAPWRRAVSGSPHPYQARLLAPAPQAREGAA